MPNPAFVMIGDRFGGSTGFGISAFGPAPFGGPDWPAVELPSYQLGSDSLQKVLRRAAAEIIHRRNGIPVEVRPFATLHRWAVNFSLIPEADVVALGAFFDARVFRLLPNGNPAEYRRVHWLGEEFAPVYIKPGFYSLAFELEEFPE